MSYNGNGVFLRLYSFVQDAAANIKIRADRMDNELTGIANGLSTAITKDGQTTITANLPMATYKHTNVGAGAVRTEYTRLDQTQDGKINWVDGGGTADAITAAYSPAIATLVDGQECYVRATAANATTTPTFSPGGLTARAIVKFGNVALAAGDIAGDGHELHLRYRLSDTKWELLNPAVTGAFSGAISAVGTVAIAGTSSIAGGFTLAEDTDNGTNKVTVRGPASLASDYTLTLPTAQGAAGSFLTNDGSGNLSFSASLISALKDKVLNGLILSNNSTDSTNDIDISAGDCVSDDGTTVMTLTAITKRLDAAWAVGTNQGGLDTGSIANTTYHVWVINRPDTNVTDVLFSTSATSPTMPTNYTKKKRIGSIVRASGAILLFTQREDEFRLNTYQSDYGAAGVGSSSVTVALASVPSGIIAKASFNFIIGDNGAYIAFYDGDKTAAAASTIAAPLADGGTASSGTVFGNAEVWTDTSSQIKFRGNGNTTVRIATKGWRDPGCR